MERGKRMEKHFLIACAVAVMFSSGIVFAALDYVPAPWRTDPIGQPPTTYQSWDFTTDANPTAPDVDLNPYGTAELTVTGDFFSNTVWYETLPGYPNHQGIWGYEEDIQVLLPNNPVQNPYKEVWVQITYTASNAPNIYVLPEGNELEYVFMDLVDNQDIGDGWFHAAYYAIVEPNPTFELNVIRPADCTLYVDDLIIETVCDVPEPATLAILGLGALLMRTKRS